MRTEYDIYIINCICSFSTDLFRIYFPSLWLLHEIFFSITHLYVFKISISVAFLKTIFLFTSFITKSWSLSRGFPEESVCKLWLVQLMSDELSHTLVIHNSSQLKQVFFVLLFLLKAVLPSLSVYTLSNITKTSATN